MFSMPPALTSALFKKLYFIKWGTSQVEDNPLQTGKKKVGTVTVKLLPAAAVLRREKAKKPSEATESV